MGIINVARDTYIEYIMMCFMEPVDNIVIWDFLYTTGLRLNTKMSSYQHRNTLYEKIRRSHLCL